MPNRSVSLQSAKPRLWGTLQVKWLEFFNREIFFFKKVITEDGGAIYKLRET